MAHLRVLLIESPADIRRALRMRLHAEGFDVIGEASSADESAETVRAPAVVLIDVRPVKAGLAEVRATRRAFPEAAVVLLTLDVQPELEAQATAAGATSLVAKHRVEDVLLPLLRRLERDAGAGTPGPFDFPPSQGQTQ